MVGLLIGGTAVSVEAQRWGRPRPPSAGACFYQDANFDGDWFCVGLGDAHDQMPDGLNDRVSSIRVFGNAEVTVFRDPGLSGRSTRFSEDQSNLQFQNWNDTISSLMVRRRGGSSGGGDPDRIIRRAYQDLLDREPDQNGLREYRRRMIDDGWSETQVRDAIRRSPEYRQRNMMTRARAEDIVRRAYQSTLGREPDPAAASWVTEVIRNRWTQADLERELRKTPEYRNRRPPR
jgi:hypothetical protein